MAIVHYVTFPDGTEVRGASLDSRRCNDRWRQFGLYLDPAWRPTWPAVTIAWPDFGLPKSRQLAAAEICAAFAKAREGVHVEIGCVGGLGRTGTTLACMAALAGVASRHAVGWVREHYDDRLVETTAQERWVLWFAGEAKRRQESRREEDAAAE